MSPKSQIALTLSLLPAIAAACGEVHGIPIDKTATDIARTVCPRAYECCTTEQLMKNETAGTSVSDCEAKTADEFRKHLQGLQYSEDAGRSTYDPAKVEACLQTIRQSTCAELNMTYHLVGVPGCETFVTPRVALGGECSNHYECVEGWCDTPKEGEPPGPGHCTSHVAPGLSCDGDSACGAGYRCDGQSHVCVQSGGTGAACSAPGQCASGVCSGDATTPGTCGPSTVAMCFYQSGCSAGGDGTPNLATLLLFGAFAVVSLTRFRRSQGTKEV
jgi:hypothetical protein